MKKRALLPLLFIIYSLLFILASCSAPSAEEPGEGYFTISLSVSENTRAVYPPTNTNDLRFVAKFKDTANGKELAYTSDGSGTIQGKIDVGNYIVTMDVSLISDGSSYARGIAYDNPIEIASGKNSVKVYVYDVNKAAPPVVSAKPLLVYEIVGSHIVSLPITASVGDGGTLSYQWFSNTTDSNAGGTPISTSQSFSSSSIWGGTAYYYAEITNTKTGSGGPSSIKTKPVKVSVSNGTGTTSDPFLVYDVAGLQKVGSETFDNDVHTWWGLDAHYKQTADIDLASVPNWTPIGTDKAPFTGNYDGNGYTISNLTINAPTEGNKSLFGRISYGAVVKNVGVINCNITGYWGVGGVVGESYYGTVQNCYATGNISCDHSVGGVVGYNNDNGTVQNCYFTGNVSGNNSPDNPDNSITKIGGGVVGSNFGTVQNCYATGSVSGNGIAGGVVGANSGTVQYCYATSIVFCSANSYNGPHSVGGVVGDNDDNGTVQYCYATGNISSDSWAGGVVGYNFGTVQNCYATGNVSSSHIGGGWVESGGVVGCIQAGTVQYCYATGNVSSINGAGGVAGHFLKYNSLSLEAKVQNCIALNPDISASGTGIGRVVGEVIDISGIPTFLASSANNYGREDMKKNGGSPAWTNIGLNDFDGADVSASQYNSQSWWTTAGNWASAGWNFNTVWAWGSNNLPILRNMPGTTTQNPVVK